VNKQLPPTDGETVTTDRDRGGALPTASAGAKRLLRPYGDTTGDGMVQLSFTLPMASSKIAEGAATQLANKMGMDPALVVHSKAMGPDFTFFVVYGRVNHLVDPSTVVVVERDYELLSPKEVNAAVKSSLRRRLVVVGGCIGTDAHTVGIDAILNIKGFAGEKGLEYYREIKVVNLGAQVSVPQLVERAVEEKADAVLVSQVVTQRDAHLLNTREMSAAFREAFPPARRPLLVVGGPRFDETMAADLGVDRVFTRRGGQLSRAPHRHPEGGRMSAEVGTTVVHRRYVSYAEAHYAGNLVDGAWGLGLFGDVATEMCIRTDGDEGLFASYSDVQFRAPVRAGDVVEARATLTRVGRRSREMAFELVVVARGDQSAASESAARMLDEPVVATTAIGTVVVPSAS
jgi:beta-lysine 5,6-aminomutase beta subunit